MERFQQEQGSKVEGLRMREEIKGFFGDYRWLSNFHACPVYYEGLIFQSVEHAYQAAKLATDEERLPFTNPDLTPGQAKQLGGKVKLAGDKWDSRRVDIMSAIVFDKFYRNTDLRKKLAETGQAYLEETNTWGDEFWGVCGNKGENHLGNILTCVRRFWEGVD